MKIGFKTSQTNVDWPTLCATWELGDELTVFDSAWIFDHFVALGEGGGGSHEAFVTMAALAALTHRLQLGHLVLGNTYRHPALVAKSGATMDDVSRGRFVLAWAPVARGGARHVRYDLPPIGERITMMESAVRVIKALWRSPQGVSLDAPPYRLQDAVCNPPPFTAAAHPWLGTQGLRRGLRIVAELADGWNRTGDPARSWRNGTPSSATARRWAGTRPRSRSARRSSRGTACRRRSRRQPPTPARACST